MLGFVNGVVFVVLCIVIGICYYLFIQVNELRSEVLECVGLIVKNRKRIRFLTKRIYALEKGEKIDVSKLGALDLDELDYSS